MAKKVYAQLARNGRVSRGYLGVNLQALSPAVAKSVGYEGVEGALVGDLTPDGPASKSGLRSGDVIVGFDGQPVKSPKHLTELVGDTPVGRSVQLKYVRDGRTQTTTITLGERPGRNVAENKEADEQTGGKLGVSASNVTPEIARELKLKVNSGAVIEQVQPDSPAAEAGLQRGDVVHRLNRTNVATARDLTAALPSLRGEHEVVLQVERDGQLMFITVPLE